MSTIAFCCTPRVCQINDFNSMTKHLSQPYTLSSNLTSPALTTYATQWRHNLLPARRYLTTFVMCTGSHRLYNWSMLYKAGHWHDMLRSVQCHVILQPTKSCHVLGSTSVLLITNVRAIHGTRNVQMSHLNTNSTTPSLFLSNCGFDALHPWCCNHPEYRGSYRAF